MVVIMTKENKFSVYDGKVVGEIRNPKNGIWQARFKIAPKKWKRFSCGTVIKKEAEAIAAKEYDKFLRAGDSYEAITVKQAIFEYCSWLVSAIGTPQNIKEKWFAKPGIKSTVNHNDWIPSYANHLNALYNHFIPFFEGRKITDIKKKDFEEFIGNYRIKNGGDKIKPSTFGNYSKAFNTFRTYATKDDKFVKETQIPRMIKSDFHKSIFADYEERRPFTKDELQKIIDYIKDVYIKQTTNPCYQKRRTLLRYFIVFCAQTGCRPVQDINLLRFKDISKHPDNENWLMLTLKGKDIIHDAVGDAIVKQIIEKIIELHDDLGNFDSTIGKSNKLVFADPVTGDIPEYGRMFNRLLKDIGMKTMNDKEMIFYCIRHYYMMKKLKEKVSYESIKRQMGTSIPAIEQFYSNHRTEIDAAELIGTSEEHLYATVKPNGSIVVSLQLLKANNVFYEPHTKFELIVIDDGKLLLQKPEIMDTMKAKVGGKWVDKSIDDILQSSELILS